MRTRSTIVRAMLATGASGALLVLLAACVGIPTQGSVQAGPVAEEAADDGIVFNPFGPTAGDDQLGILRGFVAAFNGPKGDYEVARQFLAEDVRTEWDPRQSVLIRSNAPPTFRVVDATNIEFTFNTHAQLDELGYYTANPSAQQTLTYGFVQEGGEWRISEAPNGIVVPESTFTRIFSPHSIYFYDLDFRYLVPDQRWYPGGTTTATRIVSALLQGPPDRLRGAVVSQFPEGTQIEAGNTVAVEENTATVALSSEAAAASDRQRQLMRLQLSQSLSSVSRITTVDMTIGGVHVPVTSLGADAPEVNPTVDSRPLVLVDDQFGYGSGGELTPIPALSEKVVALGATAATLNAASIAAAVMAGDGSVYVARTGELPPAVLDSRPGLVPPTMDDYGYVWSVPADIPNGIIAFDFTGGANPVASSLPASSRVVSIDVSRDGTRLATLLQTPSGPRLIVSGIVRDAARGFAPTGLVAEPLLDANLEGDTAIDASWVDQLSVATLVVDDVQHEVDLHELGGVATALGRPGPSVAIVGGNGRLGIRVLGDDGVLSAPRGSSWQHTQLTVAFIATQR